MKEKFNNAEVRGPFGSAALDLHDKGLVPLPCGGGRGKAPLLANWPRAALSRERIEELVLRYGAENVGIVCGRSNLVVVDVDSADLLEPMLQRFGDTPLIGKTSKGYHLYYREGSRKVRGTNLKREGLNVDILAGDNFVVVPPSLNPETGQRYEFFRGDWSCLPFLPEFRVDALPSKPGRRLQPNGAPALRQETGQEESNIGQRNDALFTACLRAAPTMQNLEELSEFAMWWNQKNNRPPLEDREAKDTAKSAWNIQIEGRNWVGTKGMVPISKELACLLSRFNALSLYVVLWCEHGSREEPFAVCRRGMARKKCIPYWKESRYRRALEFLVKVGLLEVAKGGGRGPNRPAYYRLRDPRSLIFSVDPETNEVRAEHRASGAALTPRLGPSGVNSCDAW